MKYFGPQDYSEHSICGLGYQRCRIKIAVSSLLPATDASHVLSVSFFPPLFWYQGGMRPSSWNQHLHTDVNIPSELVSQRCFA